MMKKHGLRRFFSLLLAVFMVCTLLPTAALAEDTTDQQSVVVEDQQDKGKQGQPKDEDPPAPPQNPEQGTPPADGDDGDKGSDSQTLTSERGSKPVTITVRVFSASTGEAVVGSDTAGAGNPGQIQSADYKIPPLTKFVDSSKFGRVTKVVGNWYFPSGDQQPGVTVQWSTNSGNGTMTYWVDWYNPDGGSSTTYLWNFTLKYDANGGTGAPADQTWGTNDKYTKSHTFDIPNTVPTRDGYVFKGWSDTKGGSATRQPGGTCLVSQTASGYNGGSVTKTLYAVWEEDAPAQPTPLDEADVKTLLGENAVQIICTNTQIGHDSKTFCLIDGTFTVRKDNNRRYEVVIKDFNPYVSAFDAAVSVTARTHITDNRMAGQNKTKINLVWIDGKWTADAPAKYHVLCNLQPAPSSPPTFSELVDILGAEAVKVVCTNAAAGHDEATYALKRGTISNGSFSGGPNGHTYKFDINSAKYVAAYNETTGKTHTPDDAAARVTLVWENGGWTVQSDIPAIFRVACVTEIVPPEKPTDEELANLETAVEVTCTTKPETHAAAHFSLIAGTYTIGNVVGNETDGYTCDITVTADRYVAWYNLDYGKHTLTGDNTKTLTLKYVEGQWAVDTPVTFTVICPPAKPGAKDLAKLEAAVKVVCTTKPEMHATAQFSLRNVTCTIGDVVGNETDGYTCDITVTADVYVGLYNMDYGKHTLLGDNTKTLTLKYVEGQWAFDDPVSFNVTCVAQPTFDELKELFKQKIFVECNTKPAHTKTPYDLIAGSYTIEDFSTMTDFPTCTVVLNSKKYVESFNGTTNAVHTPENEVKRVGLILRDGRWGVAKDDQLPVVFKVACVPDAPTDDYLKDLLREKVKVTCTATADHATLACDLLNGSYQGSGVQPDGNGGYTYTVTIKAEKYVERYNTKWPKSSHYLVEGEPTEKSVTLVWNADEDKWVFADPKAVPVIFRVECLTVTYEDGVNGSVFKTVSFPNLKKGEATPTIEDPIRVGYKFAGWEPTVAATVTENVTYIAQWEEVDTTFTVKYNDNVKGKAFKEQVYEDLKYNEDTPDFNGKPERSGYTFTGWKPVVADRVTKDVVYYAQWKSNSGKDRVPKTGDGQIVMILGSVLLFSFCGATAVCLNDRKRKQG